ncbi:chaplin [Streptomyces sp. 900105245]
MLCSVVRRGLGLLAAAGLVVLSGAAVASADGGANAFAFGSSGVLSGNVIQIPVHVPINLCGNTVDIIAGLNAASGFCAQ